MISKVDICNLALAHIGQRTINALTESSNEARKCNLFFDHARRATLQAIPWNFATRVQALALIANAESDEWEYVYARPSNCLMLRRVYCEGTVDNVIPDEYEEFSYNSQNAIGCDVEDAYAKFTRDVTDPNDFSIAYVDALAYKLAAYLAKPLTGDFKITDAMDKFYQRQLSDAARLNAISSHMRPKEYSSYIDAR